MNLLAIGAVAGGVALAQSFGIIDKGTVRTILIAGGAFVAWQNRDLILGLVK